MSNKLLIKICGICDAEIAKQTALLGADYIGLIFYPDSKRNVNLQQARLLSHIIKENSAIPVAVFVNQSAEEMQEICHKTNIDTVQLHGDISREQHYLLPETYTRIYVISINPDNTESFLSHDDHEQSEETAIQKDLGLLPLRCSPQRDFLLFDHVESGKGKSFDWTKFYHFHESLTQKNFRWFLAGGLNSDNIKLAIQKLNPTGIDVSSGVENQSGQKDVRLIQRFIKEARR